MSTPLLQMLNIETYYGPIMAIRGVSLDVHEGEIVTNHHQLSITSVFERC